jgi:hypothetical protein
MNRFEEELEESHQHIIPLHQQISEATSILSAQIEMVEKAIEALRASDLDKRPNRVSLLTHLCLLSELCGLMDFNRMIKARELFVDLYPQHFKTYLELLERGSWEKEIGWSGCFDCIHFSSKKCSLNQVPIESRGEGGTLVRSCPSLNKRKKRVWTGDV